MDDLIVVGAGWAGMAATAYAVERGAKIRLIAQGIGSMILRPGWISVWDSNEEEEEGYDTLAMIRPLTKTLPDHPYSLAGTEALLQACMGFERISRLVLNLPYRGGTELTNSFVPTALGSPRLAAVVPYNYLDSPGGYPFYIGFEGWRDYYPALSGPNTATIQLPMSDRLWDATPTDLARQFDSPEFRKEVAAQVKSVLSGKVWNIGFPAVLGLENPYEAFQDLWKLLDTPIFEIPTLPPSVPGTRLFNKMRRYFLDHGVRVQIGHPVMRGIIENGRIVGVEVAAAGKLQRFYAKAVILATGGLYGGGLFSDDRGRIWEPIFDLPVSYEPDRTRWFNEDLLDPRGHPVHYFGLHVNDRMQPIDANGKTIYEGLHAIGRLLALPQAENTPLPSECAEGVALATAYKAVTTALAAIGLNSSSARF